MLAIPIFFIFGGKEEEDPLFTLLIITKVSSLQFIYLFSDALCYLSTKKSYLLNTLNHTS